jgi:hypothetical protein
MNGQALPDVIDRLRAEYLEMPGLRLTSEQVSRLCGIDPTICKGVLDALTAEGFLCPNSDGTYARVPDGSFRRRAAKASTVTSPRASGVAKAS